VAIGKQLGSCGEKPKEDKVKLPVRYSFQPKLMRRPLPLLALFLSTVAPAFALAMGTVPPDKAVITLTPKFGPVTFSHQRHSELESVDCATCHHTLESDGEPIQSCYNCHQARHYSIARTRQTGSETAQADNSEPQLPDAQQAFHTLCTGCHKQRREQQLPTGPDDSCRDCHG